MRVSQCVSCEHFPCSDINNENYIVPDINLDPQAIKILLISEAAPVKASDYYYAPGDPLFQQTTVLAFRDAGVNVSSVSDILKVGVYLTTAVKCGKTGYGIKAQTIKECSYLLEKEIEIFPKTKAILLMGDVAIKAFNYISKRRGQGRVIPAASTYKIRGESYFFGDVRVFPSYLQAGPSFFIEKSKRRMIAEDIATAVAHCNS